MEKGTRHHNGHIAKRCRWQGNLPAEKTCWKHGKVPDLTRSTMSRTPVSDVMSAVTQVMRSGDPAPSTFFRSFSAESWFRTRARTLRPERRAA